MKQQHRLRRIAASIAGVLLALGLGACSPFGDDTITIGFVAVGPEGAWRKANEADVQSTFTPAAGYELRYAPSADLDKISQIASFLDFVDQGVDVILLSATEGSGWVGTLERAKSVGVPVILVDRGIVPDDPALYITRVAPDNREVAAAVAGWALETFPGGAGYVVLEGPAGVGVVKERNEGWDSVITDRFTKLGAATANWSADEGRAVLAAMLKEHGDRIDLVFAQNDEMGIGAAQAVEEAGLVPGVDVKIATIDGTRGALEALVAGRLSFVAEYNPLFGQTLVDVVARALAGEPLPASITVPSRTFDSPESAAEALPNRQF